MALWSSHPKTFPPDPMGTVLGMHWMQTWAWALTSKCSGLSANPGMVPAQVLQALSIATCFLLMDLNLWPLQRWRAFLFYFHRVIKSLRLERPPRSFSPTTNPSIIPKVFILLQSIHDTPYHSGTIPSCCFILTAIHVSCLPQGRASHLSGLAFSCPAHVAAFSCSLQDFGSSVSQQMVLSSSQLSFTNSCSNSFPQLFCFVIIFSFVKLAL